jgi:hypothetical protein
MQIFLLKIRFLTTIVALCLCGHYVVLAAHLACDYHPYCDKGVGQILGPDSADDHEHCLVQLTFSRLSDSSDPQALQVYPAVVFTGRLLGEVPRIIGAKRDLQTPQFRSSAGSQFIRSVRIIS